MPLQPQIRGGKPPEPESTAKGGRVNRAVSGGGAFCAAGVFFAL
ncbi:hypothetical protein HMPREF9413_0786 [Paenibacillus sp. HGF7]|nr:hypothetical protein HMPREF9413_0786 [Paenibacillus sp. HGF7]